MFARYRRLIPDLAALLVLLLIPMVLFMPVTLGNRTLIPADNLLQWAPWDQYREEVGAPAHAPDNHLLSDLLLENLPWKQFVRDSISKGEIPLWNPYIFAGSPFLSAGQHSALYPFSIVFWIFPLLRAYGIFTISQLFLAGAFMFLFARVLKVGKPGALVAAIIYQLCGFFMVSVNFPMIVAGAAWLPFLLACIELVIQGRGFFGIKHMTLPWVAVGAFGLGMHLLAGHGENTFFTLLVMALFAAWRLVITVVRERSSSAESSLWLSGIARRSAWLLAMVILGLGLGAVQLIPMFELVQHNFREGAVSLSDVLGWSFPVRRLITFIAPNFFGNPSHHTYFDLFIWKITPVSTNLEGNPIRTITWGLKNYVEGGVYFGILPLALAFIAILGSFVKRERRGLVYAGLAGGQEDSDRSVTWFFGLLSVVSLSLIFRTGAYAIIHIIPIVNQSHSPFRWVFPLSLSVAVLAGMGVRQIREWSSSRRNRWVNLTGWLLLVVGFGMALALVVARLVYPMIQSFVDRVFLNLALASTAFPNVEAFFSYEVLQLLVASIFTLAAGAALLWASRSKREWIWPRWTILAAAMIAIDLALATWGFNPSADPGLLSKQPEVIQFLTEQDKPFRVTTFDPHGYQPLHANTLWLFGLEDIRGYDSIILSHYVQYMEGIEEQGELLYNRIQPIKNWQSLNSPLLDLLNVKYVVTHEQIDLPKLQEVWQEGDLRIYENLTVSPRAFTLPANSLVIAEESIEAMKDFDPRLHVIVDAQDAANLTSNDPVPAIAVPAAIRSLGSQEVEFDVVVEDPSWLIHADNYFPGWRGYIRPHDSEDETEVEVYRVNGTFRGVQLEPGKWIVRLKYTPMSFKLGLFLSFVSAVVIVFLGAVWLWRLLYCEPDEDSTVKRVAKNSLAPMVLSLYNRGIDFAFALLMLRILGAENAGKFYVAVNIALWFEILANFGLHTLVMREVAKERTSANQLLVNTTILRFLTSIVAAVPIALYVIALGSGEVPLPRDTVLATSLFMIGMIPGGINTGLTALFIAHERNEVPASIATVSTLVRVVLSTAVLLLGYGFVGLASVSIVVNVVTLIVLAVLVMRTFFVPKWTIDWGLQRSMLKESYPLMLNHLLATLFFKVDILLLERLAGTEETSANTVVGWYSTAYRWIDALNIVPAMFTMAIFPLLSRQADDAKRTMQQTWRTALKLLTITSIPFAVMIAFAAPKMIGLLGGSEYLPHGSIALQWMIWSIPIGWMNSVTNYVLIALNLQRKLTIAFVVGVVFNVTANIIFIPQYGYRAAAVITILSELILLTMFYIYARSTLETVHWWDLMWRPTVAAVFMAGATWVGWQVYWILGLVAGAIVYLGVIVLLKVLDDDERAILGQLVPSAKWRVRDTLDGSVTPEQP
ncbi:MAG: oligosaccharide flippase family protein [Chloroflexota bacterium]